MDTLLKSNHVLPYLRTEQKHAAAKKLWENLESVRFGIIPVLLVIIGCLGGLAAAFGAHDNSIKLSLVAFPTIIAAALVLGLAPMKLVLYVSVPAVIIDIAVLFL